MVNETDKEKKMWKSCENFTFINYIRKKKITKQNIYEESEKLCTRIFYFSRSRSTLKLEK